MRVPLTLFVNCLGNFRMVIAERIHGKSAKHIEIPFTVFGREIHAVPAFDLERKSFIGVKEILGLAFKGVHVVSVENIINVMKKGLA